MKPAVFLDRDGVLIEDQYVTHFRHVRFIRGAMDAVRILHEAGFRLVMWSNQGGVVERSSVANACAIMRYVRRAIADDTDVVIDTRFCCYHPAPLRCTCRKPSPTLLWQAAGELNLDLRQSWVVDDWPVNLQAASAVGANGMFVGTGRGRRSDAWQWQRCHNLLEAAEWISEEGMKS